MDLASQIDLYFRHTHTHTFSAVYNLYHWGTTFEDFYVDIPNLKYVVDKFV